MYIELGKRVSLSSAHVASSTMPEGKAALKTLHQNVL
jgi:hypothetical protein